MNPAASRTGLFRLKNVSRTTEAPGEARLACRRRMLSSGFDRDFSKRFGPVCRFTGHRVRQGGEIFLPLESLARL